MCIGRGGWRGLAAQQAASGRGARRGAATVPRHAAAAPPPAWPAAGLRKQELAQLVYDTVDANGMRDHVHVRLMVRRLGLTKATQGNAPAGWMAWARLGGLGAARAAPACPTRARPVPAPPRQVTRGLKPTPYQNPNTTIGQVGQWGACAGQDARARMMPRCAASLPSHSERCAPTCHPTAAAALARPCSPPSSSSLSTSRRRPDPRRAPRLLHAAALLHAPPRLQRPQRPGATPPSCSATVTLAGTRDQAVHVPRAAGRARRARPRLEQPQQAQLYRRLHPGRWCGPAADRQAGMPRCRARVRWRRRMPPCRRNAVPPLACLPCRPTRRGRTRL